MESANEQVFLARQPIFDRQKRAVGYELLFRAPRGFQGPASTDQEDAALISEAVLAFGLDTLTYGRLAFIKVTRSLLLAGLPPALPARQVVFELPNDVGAAPEALDACADLRHKGYRIALDHFMPNDEIAPLVPLADYVKTDMADLPAVARQILSTSHAALPRIVATRVETADHFKTAAALGCASFQGGFIGRPVMRVTNDIPANRLTYLRLLRALESPDISPRELEDLIKPDASLVYRTLRAVNSAAFAQHNRVDSIRQALTLLGCDTVRRWASLWAMTSFSAGAPDELVAMATLRGRTCEIVANADVSGTLGDGFLLGLCSLLDAILEVPMSGILAHLPLPEEADAALRGRDNHSRRLLDCIIAYEHGDWDRYLALANKAELGINVVPSAYAQALKWYEKIESVSPAA